MPKITKTFRVFISSTFSDMKEERRILKEEVFPRLKEFCESRSASFQDVDMRWGVSEEAGFDQRTMDICLGEIVRCQRLSPKPNFIILLGDKYGWQPLPAQIPSSEMEKILVYLAENEKKIVQQWYLEDFNAVPCEYVLQPRYGEYLSYEKWVSEEAKLRDILRQTVVKLPFTEMQRIKYFVSATHQEVLAGALNPTRSAVDPQEHVFAYLRTIKDLPSDASAKDYIDICSNGRDSYCKEQLKRLKRGLRSKLPEEHIYPYGATWNKGCALDNAKTFGDRVYADLSTIIESQLKEIENHDQLFKDIAQHKEFQKHLLEHFTGRKDALNVISNYLNADVTKVFSVIGPSGIGKTSLMAKAIEEASEREGITVFRFIGTTLDSSDNFRLLLDIIREITRKYGTDMNALLEKGDDEKKLSTLAGLEEIFSRCLGLATKQKPLYIFLDALDQLSRDYASLSLKWIPSEIPKNVKIVLSALPILKEKLAYAIIFNLDVMSGNDGEELLNRWLASKGRTLSSHQKQDILHKFVSNGTPLYLKLVFERCKEWYSYSQHELLSSDMDRVVGEFFDKLESDHGSLMVRKVCGYLLLGKYQGLMEQEILDLLVFDQECWHDFLEHCHPSHRQEVKRAGKLPIVVWSRLFMDLEPYLAEREADGLVIISFFNRKFSEYVRKRYLSSSTVMYHTLLADYFEKDPLYLDEKEKVPNVRKVAEQPFQATFVESKWKDVVDKSLGNFSFLMAKAKANMLEEILEDYAFFRDKVPGIIMNKLNLWQVFFKKHIYMLRRGNSKWPAYKILLQLAAEHTDENPVTIGVEQWLKGGCCNWPWLRRNKQLPYAAKKTCPDVLAKYSILRFLYKYVLDFSKFFMQRIFKIRIMQQHYPVVFEGHSYFGENDSVSAFETKDGRFLSWANDHALRLWGRSGNTICVFEGHTATVKGVFETKDGCFLSWANDHTLRLWDKFGAELAVFKGHTEGVVHVLEIKDGYFLSSSLDKTLRLWNDSGVSIAVFKGHSSAILGILEIKDGRFLSWGADSRFLLWDREGKLFSVLEGYKLSSPDSFGLRKGMITGVFKTKQGHFLSWSSWGGCDLYLWGNDGIILYTFKGHTTSVNGVLETIDGRFLSWANDNTLRLWDRDGNTICVFEGHTGFVTGALETKDGRFLSWSQDKTLRFWDKDGMFLCVLEGHTSNIIGAFEIRDGGFLSWAGDQCPRIWHRDGRFRAAFKGYPVHNAFETRDGNFFSSMGGNSLLLWNIKDTSCVAFQGHTSSVRNTLETSDGNFFSWANDTSPRLWNRGGKQLHAFEGHAGMVKGALKTNDGRFLSWSEDNTLRLWSKDGSNLAVLEGHTNAINGAFETKNGRFLSWSDDGTIRLWHMSGMFLTSLKGHRGAVLGVFETKDGHFISWAGYPHQKNCTTILLWSSGGKLLYTLKGHTDIVRGVLETKDGRFLSWADDHTLRLWDKGGNTLYVFKGHTWTIQGAIETEDGYFLSWADDGSLRFWDASGRPLTVFEGKNGWVEGVLKTKEEQFLLWNNYGTLWSWDKDGRSIGSYSIEEGLHKFPEFRIAYCGKENNVFQSSFRGIAKSGCLTTHYNIKTVNIFWQGDSTCTARHLKSNGYAVLSQKNGQVCFLHIYYGNKPISVEELENIECNSGNKA